MIASGGLHIHQMRVEPPHRCLCLLQSPPSDADSPRKVLKRAKTEKLAKLSRPVLPIPEARLQALTILGSSWLLSWSSSSQGTLLYHALLFALHKPF